MYPRIHILDFVSKISKHYINRAFVVFGAQFLQFFLFYLIDISLRGMQMADWGS